MSHRPTYTITCSHESVFAKRHLISYNGFDRVHAQVCHTNVGHADRQCELTLVTLQMLSAMPRTTCLYRSILLLHCILWIWIDIRSQNLPLLAHHVRRVKAALNSHNADCVHIRPYTLDAPRNWIKRQISFVRHLPVVATAVMARELASNPSATWKATRLTNRRSDSQLPLSVVTWLQ